MRFNPPPRSPLLAPRSTRRARPAFTLIELLVVIGIILVLIAIVVMGLRHVNYTAARHETIAEFKICQDILKEYESVNGLSKIEASSGSVVGFKLPSPPLDPTPFNLPIFLDPPTGEIKGAKPAQISVYTPDNLTALGQGDMGDRIAPKTARYAADAVWYTQGVMFVLLKDPKNRVLIQNVPAKRLLESPPPASAGGPPNPVTPIDASVILDGWGNPIVFVPRGGAQIDMNPTGQSNGLQPYRVKSTGTTAVALNVSPTLSPNDRPFFMSAGQDGYFTDPDHKLDYGIDNLYSFQEQ